MSVDSDAPLESSKGSHDVLADLIRDAETSITLQWLKMVEPTIEQKSIDAKELENSIRKFLRHLEQRLRAGGRGPAPSATEHGHQRFEIGYRLAQTLEEYGLLLDAVEHVARSESVELDASSIAALARNVVAGAAEAVVAFVEQERAERDKQASRRFAFVAHELRNPIQSLALGLESWGEHTDPRFLRPVFERAVGHLRRLVDRELVAAVEIHRVDPRGLVTAEPFDMVELVQEVISVSAPFAEPRGIELTLDCPESIAVSLDREMLWSIVTNLIRNAIKFSREDSHVQVRLRVIDDDRLQLEVEDECGGLPEEARAKIFDAFMQRGEDRSGFGLGLSIARAACSAHGGSIEVNGLPDGCMFIVEVPRRFQN